MTILYTVNKSPHQNLLGRCKPFLQPGDALLFLEDGAYHCTEPGQLGDIGQQISVYFLKEDMLARGLLEKVDEQANLLSYRKFVDLCTKHDKVVSWF